MDIAFANANYYLAYVLDLAPPATVTTPTYEDWTFVLVGSNSEFVTAAEAEADMEEYAMWLERPWAEGGTWKGYPLCGLVLRNDGTPGPGGHIRPIEKINRGGSYIWPTDLRPRWSESW
jgi:hypothetical protein